MYALVCKYRIFSEELSGQRLKEYFIKSILEWSHASLEMENFTVLEFLDSLNCGWFWFFVMAVFCRYLLVFLVLLLCNTAYIHRVHSLFLALCINRCSVLSYKKKKKKTFLSGVSQENARVNLTIDCTTLWISLDWWVAPLLGSLGQLTWRQYHWEIWEPFFF